MAFRPATASGMVDGRKESGKFMKISYFLPGKAVVKTAVRFCGVLFVAASVGGAVPAAAEAKKAVEAAKKEAKNQAALTELVSQPGLFAKPKAKRKVLLVAQAFGYVHKDAIVWGSKALELTGEKGAFEIVRRDDCKLLADPAFLSGFDAIVLNNTTSLSEKRTPGMTKTLNDYVASGKGICFIHSALDAFYDSPGVQEMAGGLFFGHPWFANSDCLFVNEHPEDPINAAFGGKEKFRTSDEIYMQKTPPYDRSKCKVLVSLDRDDEKNKKYEEGWRNHPNPAVRKFKLREDRDYAVSWTREYGKGRVFYTSFGHDSRAFLDPVRLRHIIAGLQYCLGDL